MCCGSTCTWRWTLARWQPKQAFAQAVTSVERPFQTYLEEIRRRVACLPGWAVLWRCSKTCRQRSGTEAGVVETPAVTAAAPGWPGVGERRRTCHRRSPSNGTERRSGGYLGRGSEVLVWPRRRLP
jgi:hypothetical protein